jgi:hypothetical protein
MAHYDRELDDNEYGVGPLSPTVLRNIDQKTFESINGDGGGIWAPAVPIYVAGAGMQLLSASQASGSGAIYTSAGKRITHDRGDADDYIGVSAARNLSDLLVPCSDYAFVSLDNSLTPHGAQPRAHGTKFMARLRVHHGATLASVTLIWIVRGSRTGVPQFRPRMRVIRVDAEGTVKPLRVASDTDPDGYYTFGSTVSSAAYVNSNLPQSIVYTCNQTAIQKVDVGAHAYFVDVIDESGTNAYASGSGNIFFTATTSNTNITHLGPQ